MRLAPTVQVVSAEHVVEALDGPGPVAVIGPVHDLHVGGAIELWLPEESSGFARGLYDALRTADALGVVRIVVVPPVRGPLVEAVLDRLAKAASPR